MTPGAVAWEVAATSATVATAPPMMGPMCLMGRRYITIDLNGHTIDGQSTHLTDCDVAPFGASGINNDAGHDGIDVKGGTVQAFDNGLIGGFGRSVLSRLTLRANRFSGIAVGSADPDDNIADNRIQHNHLVANGCQAAIKVSGANNRIDDNRLEDNGSGIVVLFVGRSGPQELDHPQRRTGRALLFR